MNRELLEGRVAVVTGGSSGIGQAACLALAREGARVVVVGRTPAHVEETLARIDSAPGADPAARLGLVLDVRKESDMEEMARRTLDFYGRIDILIASAGISAVTSATPGGNSPVAKLSLESWEEIIATNLRGTFLACRAVLRSMMRERRGEILIVSSSLGTALGWAYASAYCASKFAVMGLAEALAQEVQGHGIRVQVVLPDAVDTPMLRKSRLAVRGSLSGEQAAELILELLTAPGDMVCVNPMIEPFGTWEKTGHRKALAG